MTPFRHIRVLGNSGCTVALVDENTVRKVAHGPESERLRRQIDKQESFGFDSQRGRIRIPEIRKISATLDSCSAEMEFIAAKDFVQFLMEADRENLNDFVIVVVNFIQGNLGRAVMRDVTDQVVKKAEDLAKRGVSSNYIEAAIAFCADPVVVPVGSCHGDLTLSNILFKGKCLYFIDFLDSFVESPIQDVVKLRQDTYFGWSLNLYATEFDRTKIRIALDYIDKLIDTAFASFVWYQRYYTLFQVMNLMRLLPYCNSVKASAFVSAHLDQIVASLCTGERKFGVRETSGKAGGVAQRESLKAVDCYRERSKRR